MDLIKGRKPLPVGTEKIWQGKKYKKTADGWEPVSSGKPRGRPKKNTTDNKPKQDTTTPKSLDDLRKDIYNLAVEVSKIDTEISSIESGRVLPSADYNNTVRTNAQAKYYKKYDGTKVELEQRLDVLKGQRDELNKKGRELAIKIQDMEREEQTGKALFYEVGVSKLTDQEYDLLINTTQKTNRLSYGQEVIYLGKYHNHLYRQKAKIVAIGDSGFALIQTGDGKIYSSAWRDIQATGPIKPFSIYDGVGKDNVYVVGGTLKDKVSKVVNKKIGNSGYSYLDLCEEFKKRGFSLNIVGGTVRDLLIKDDTNDIDFIFDGSDRELENILKELNPSWVSSAVKNSHLGLYSFSDSGSDVDITPLHRYSTELKSFVKGWTLREDAIARDLAMNTLQLDPLKSIMVDATGKALSDIKNQEINFNDADLLEHSPVYLLRAMKFMVRGYKLTKESEDILKSKLNYVNTLSPKRIVGFLTRQIGDKDGEKGLIKFKQVFMKYNNRLWESKFEPIYKNIVTKYRGK